MNDKNNTLKDARKQFSRIGMTLFIGTLIMNAVQYLALIFTAKTPVIASSGSLTFLINMLAMYIIAFPLTFLLFSRIPVQLYGEKKSMSLKQLLTAFLIAIACAYVFNLVGNVLTLIIGVIKQSPVENVLNNLLGNISPAAHFLVIVLLAPVFEELLFRKAVIDRSIGYGEGVSVLFSGLLFGLFHGNLVQFSYAFFLGIFFGFIYVKTKSILYPIILHMMVNFVGSFVNSLIQKWVELDMTDPIATKLSFGIIICYAYILCLIAFIIAGIVIFFNNRKKFTFAEKETDLPKGQRFKTILINPGTILFSIFWIIIIILQLLA